MKKLVLLYVLCVSCTASSQKVLELNKEGNLYTTDIVLNSKVEVPFIIDTGCSTSAIPYYIAYTLLKSGTIDRKDLLDDVSSILADGSVVNLHQIRVKRLKIGDDILENVVFSVSENIEAPLLLGQNVLSRLNKVSIDYKNNTLTYEKD